MKVVNHSLTKIESDILEHQASFHVECEFDAAVKQNDGKVDPAQYQEEIDARGIDCHIYNPPLEFQRYDPERRQNGGHQTKSELAAPAGGPNVSI